MVANTAAGATYSPGAQAAGGIYVRGTVEIMRLACDAVHSYYAFQMGEMAATGKHRVYIVDVDRSARKLKLVAYPPGQTLRQLATANGNSYAAMVALAAAVTVVDPLAYGVNVPGMAAIAQAAAPPNLYPFNGIVFVDYAQNDPCRLALGSPNVHGPGDGPGTKPLSGHILALGDPGDPAGAGNPAAKQTIAPAPTALAPFLRTAEVVSSEDMTSGGTPRKASRLNIISSGSIFIQNHVLVSSIANKIDTTSLVTSLRRDNLRLQDTHDVLGLVADHQIVVGLCAPNGATRTDPGLVVTATMAALGDPQYDVESNSIPDIPTFGTPAYQAYALRGSFGVESVITLLTLGLNEPYDIGTPNAAGGFDTYTGPAPATYPTNPLYDRRGGGGTEWGFPALLDPLNNPNGLSLTRGRLMVFGSLVLKKRGAVGLGNASYDKDYRYDQRLLSLSPPLFPNSVNLVTFISKIGAAGFPPYTSGPMAAELAILN
jgi:hypothetical protein